MLKKVFNLLCNVVGYIVEFLFSFPFFDIYFVGRPFNLLSAATYTFLRFLSGAWCAQGLEQCERPVKPLKLYEFEACPYCRKVREALSVLDLDVIIYPCPKPILIGKYGVADSSSRYRSEVKNPDGKTTFPVLIDENSEDELKLIRGSDAIVAHLWETYGKRADKTFAKAPCNYKIGRALDKWKFIFFIPSLLRPLKRFGMVKVASKQPEQPLVLWGYQGSPFVKLVQEALSVLELPYRMISCAHGSIEKRNTFQSKYGQKMYQKKVREAGGAIQVPALIDPNRQERKEEPIFESAYIVQYLFDTYKCESKKQM